MNFSIAKRTLLRPRKEKWLSTFIIAFCLAAAFFVPYIIMGKGYLVYYGDFNAQQIPFYKMCHEAVRSGSFGWNWYTDLGANFIGSYSFYLIGSPFFWLTIPFPNSFVPYLMGPLLILKFACAALTSYLYIRRFTKTPEAARIGALLYAFSGFSIYNIFFNHFHEAIILFPLLLWSMELLITENKRGIFGLMVALCAISNYFFFVGMVVFCLIYFFVRVFSKALKVRLTRFLCLLLEAVLGVGIAAIILLPSFYTVIQNTRVSEVLLGWDALVYNNEQLYLNIIQSLFFPNDMPAIISFFPGTNREWSSLAAWLPLFSMVGVIAYFKLHQSSWIKKVLGISALFAFIPILNSLFSAFNQNYYARWFYMPILIMSLATATVLEDEHVSYKGAYKWTSGITLAFILAIGFIPQKLQLEDGSEKLIWGIYTQSDDSTYKLCFWLFSAMAVVCLIILLILFLIKRKSHERFLKASLCCVCVIIVIYGNCCMAIGRMYSPEVEATMINRLIEANVDFNDESHFRIDTYDCEENLGMFLNVPSINAFHSVVPGSIMDFYKVLNYERGVATRLDTTTPAVRSLLSVKYVLNPTDGDTFLDQNGNPLMPGFKYLKTDGGYYIYENENYIPFGFSYDYYMTEDFYQSYNSNNKSRLMLKAMVLSKEQANKYSDVLINLDELQDEQYLNDRLEYYQNVANGISPPLSDEDKDEDLESASDSESSEVSEDTENNTSSHEDEQEKLQEEEDTVNLELTDEEMAKDCLRLKATSAIDFKIDNKGFTATVKRDKANLVFFSVPYEEGWSCTVNGKAAEIERVNIGFMAVMVPEGESEIRFDFKTPGLALGAKISGASAALLLIYFLISLLYLRNREVKNPYPEGDELITKWQSEDNFDPDSSSAEYDLSSHTLLDDINDIENVSHPEDGGFTGGFTINTDLFD